MQSSVQQRISQAVSDLISDGLTGTQIAYSYPSILESNIYPQMRPFFTDKAGKVLHNKINNLIHQRMVPVGHEGVASLLSKLNIKSATEALATGLAGWQRALDIVVYIGSACNREELGLAAEKVIRAINELAEKGYITGAMLPLSIIQLSEQAPEDSRYLIVSYVALTSVGQKYAQHSMPDMLFTECGIPKKVGEQK